MMESNTQDRAANRELAATTIYLVYGWVVDAQDAVERDQPLAAYLWLLSRRGGYHFDRDLGLGVFSRTYLLGTILGTVQDFEPFVAVDRMRLTPGETDRIVAEEAWDCVPAHLKTSPVLGRRGVYLVPSNGALPHSRFQPGAWGSSALDWHKMERAA